MAPWTGGAPTGSFWGGIARGSVDPAERLAAELSRRAHRRSATQKSAAARLSDELVALGDDAVPVLIDHLDALGEAGCATLARMGPGVIPVLAQQLERGPSRQRSLAAHALEMTGSVAVVEPLRKASIDRDPAVRDAAQAALDGLARTLVRRLRDGHRRDETMRALANIGDRAVWPLAHMLHDRYIGVFAARVLAQIGEPAVPAVLLVFAQARRSPDSEHWDPAAANATTALAGIGAPALDPVLRLVHDEHELANVRAGAVHVLGRVGGSGASHLVAALASADPQVREAAAVELKRLSS